MLVSFSVSNFRSIGEEVTLNMVASTREKSHPTHLVPIPGTDKSLVRTAVMYGANAAGKSNLIRAMKAFQSRIISPKSSAKQVSDSFRFGQEFTSRPTSFEFRFVIGDHLFTYGADFYATVVESEWLSVFVGSRDVLLFERDRSGTVTENSREAATALSDGQLVESLGFIASAPLRPADLALSRGDELPPEYAGRAIGSVLEWLKNGLVVLDNSEDAFSALETVDTPELLGLSEEFLRRLGTGVQHLAVESKFHEYRNENRDLFDMNDGSGSALLATLARPYTYLRDVINAPRRYEVRSLRAIHPSDRGDVALDFSEESDGTRLLLKYMPILGPSKTTGRVFVIDELDGSLHPMVCRELIQAFAESCPDRQRQLIVTTHEAHLLDQELLRRDEYWFVEKDEKQQTRLTSLSDYNVRNDLQLRKGYLQGRFGGIPVIGSDERLRELLKCDGVASEQAPSATDGAPPDAP